MFNKGVLLFNDKAGGTDTLENVGAAAAVICREVADLQIIKGERPGDLEKICSRLDERTDILFIMGGDGTVHECVNGLNQLNKPPAAAILPAGTCNDFARSLNVPPEMSEAALTAVTGIKKTVDTGFVNDRLFINFAGIGLVTEASENIDEAVKEWTGSFSYFLSAVRTAREAKPFKYDVTADGESLKGEAVLIAALNGKFIGTQELPFENLSLNDGQLLLVIVKEGGFSIFKEWLQLKTQFAAADKTPNVVIQPAESISVRTEAPMMADTDGEVYLQTPLNMKAGRKLTFMTGSDSGG